ncbi:MAG: hypothetical protein ACR2PT_07425 [Endozoicomonas sp.]
MRINPTGIMCSSFVAGYEDFLGKVLQKYCKIVGANESGVIVPGSNLFTTSVEEFIQVLLNMPLFEQ